VGCLTNFLEPLQLLGREHHGGSAHWRVLQSYGKVSIYLWKGKSVFCEFELRDGARNYKFTVLLRYHFVKTFFVTAYSPLQVKAPFPMAISHDPGAAAGYRFLM
jgi:hypothetical protein